MVCGIGGAFGQGDGVMMRLRTARFAWLLVMGAVLAIPDMAFGQESKREFNVLYDIQIIPTERSAQVEIRVKQQESRLRALTLTHWPDRHTDFSADGELEIRDGEVIWNPPKQGGALRYRHRIDHKRDERSFDARCAENWAILRGDTLVPPFRARIQRDAAAPTAMRLRLPTGWNAATAYERNDDGTYAIPRGERLVGSPSGWMVVGRLGIVRESVAGTQLAIAGPIGHDVRRLDLLALLRWTLPTLKTAVGKLPPRILVVSAGDPMWRGGLSGPGSMFLHAERPLITEDATSPALHELIHIVLGTRGAVQDDGLIEGLAEYYSTQLLLRSGSLSRKRHGRALDKMAEKGRDVRSLRVERADANVAARGLTELVAVDQEIRTATTDERGLDDVVRTLVLTPGDLTVERFRSVAELIAGKPLKTLEKRVWQLPAK